MHIGHLAIIYYDTFGNIKHFYFFYKFLIFMQFTYKIGSSYYYYYFFY